VVTTLRCGGAGHRNGKGQGGNDRKSASHCFSLVLKILYPFIPEDP
jgi:hypothetical protein